MPDPLTPRQQEALDTFRKTGNVRETAEELGVARQTVQTILRTCRKKGHPVPQSSPNSDVPALGSAASTGQEINAETLKRGNAVTPGRISETQNRNPNLKTSVVYVEREPKSLEEALISYDVDREVWRVKTWEVGEWNGLAKLQNDDGEDFVQVCTLYRIKITFERFPEADTLKNILQPILERGERKAPKWRFQIKKPSKPSGLLTLNTPDLHLGKLCWSPETGCGDYDLEIACSEWRDAMRDLTAKAKQFGWKPEKIMIPVGNDLFNSDRTIGGTGGTTSNGTPQDEDGRFQKTFDRAFELLEEGFAGIAQAFGVPIVVPTVPGNHDREKVHYIGHSLGIAFRHHPLIEIERSPLLRKYFIHKRILIGLAHGDKERPEQLPLLMAGRHDLTYYVTKEWYLGHVHHRRGRSYETQAETGPVHLRWFSSLSKPDAWHASKGYEMSVPCAEAYFYNAAGRFDGSAIHFPS